MINWFQFLEKKGSHEYSCLMATFPAKITNKIKKWEKKFIDKDDLFTKEADSGFETEVHITVLYGFHDSKPDAVRELLGGPIKLVLSKTSIFETNPEYDVVKFDVQSEDLIKLNHKIRKNCEYTSDYPRYKPHCTIAYVKKGQGKKYVGDKSFEGTVVKVNELLFSPHTGNKTKIHLL